MENLGLTPGFWRGRKVLLTGHTGFKGSWLLLLLERLGADITGLSLKPEPKSLFEQIGGGGRCVHHVVDIRDFDAVKDVFVGAAPEIIFHLAAQPLVLQSYADPLETFNTNVLGTANILQAARSLEQLRAIVSVTTDKCYANDGRNTGYKEDDRLGGYDPYSNSKACAELVTQSFRDSFFEQRSVGIATARAGNVIGGGDYAANRLVPDAIRALSRGCTPELRNPGAVRPWQHVLEPLSGYCLLAERLFDEPRAYAKGWNFGPNPEDVASVATVVGHLLQHWGISGGFNPQVGRHPHEAHVLTLDSTAATRDLAWATRLRLRTAVQWTAEWYRDRLAGKSAVELCLTQIDRYCGDSTQQAAAA